MSEVTEITVNLRGWVRDIITGDDLLNNSGMAILEKQHILERAAREIELLRSELYEAKKAGGYIHAMSAVRSGQNARS